MKTEITLKNVMILREGRSERRGEISAHTIACIAVNCLDKTVSLTHEGQLIGRIERIYIKDEQRPLAVPARGHEDLSRQWNKNSEEVTRFSSDSGASPVNGYWRDADWLFCRDGKWRPVKPGLKPLVNGTPGRVGQLRAYGNAIVAPVAEAFIRAYMEAVTQ